MMPSGGLPRLDLAEGVADLLVYRVMNWDVLVFGDYIVRFGRRKRKRRPFSDLCALAVCVNRTEVSPAP